MHMTGLTATVAEREELGLRDLRVIETATLVMVLLILLVVYRNVVTILLPLVTIGVSQAAATQVVAALAQMGLAISQQTLVFMSAMMIGAGVDYAVFLISRYHEYLRQGLDSDEAVRAGADGHRQGDRRVRGDRRGHLPRHGLHHPEGVLHHRARAGRLDRGGLPGLDHAAARDPRARRPPRLGEAET